MVGLRRHNSSTLADRKIRKEYYTELSIIAEDVYKSEQVMFYEFKKSEKNNGDRA